MKRKITELDIDDLRECTESLEKRIIRLESVLCKMIEGDVKKMADKYQRDMRDYKRKWRDE
jgi:hypothetical protein